MRRFLPPPLLSGGSFSPSSPSLPSPPPPPRRSLSRTLNRECTASARVLSALYPTGGPAISRMWQCVSSVRSDGWTDVVHPESSGQWRWSGGDDGCREPSSRHRVTVKEHSGPWKRRDRRRRRREKKDGRCKRKMSLGDTRARMTGSDRRSDGHESEVVRVSPRRRWWWWQRRSSSSSSSSLRGAADAVVPALATARAPGRRERRYRVSPQPRASSKSDSFCRSTTTSSSSSLRYLLLLRQQLARIAAGTSWREIFFRDAASRRGILYTPSLVKCIRISYTYLHTQTHKRIRPPVGVPGREVKAPRRPRYATAEESKGRVSCVRRPIRFVLTLSRPYPPPFFSPHRLFLPSLHAWSLLFPLSFCRICDG